jgi:hypothetical protein
VDYFRLGNVMKGGAVFLCPLGPGQVFKTRQGFVVRMFLPERTSNGSVGVIQKNDCMALRVVCRRSKQPWHP